jgi:hypothetical protein
MDKLKLDKKVNFREKFDSIWNDHFYQKIDCRDIKNNI